MSFNLTSRQQKLLETAKALSAEFAANSKEYDDRAEFPVENFTRLHEAGLLALAVPEAYGGAGSETGNAHLAAYLVTEAISRGCSGLGWDLIIHYHQCGAVTRLGNEEQKTRILGDVVKNGAIMGSLGSEVNHQQQTAPVNASRKLTFDAQMMPVEGGFRATASKHFCSNAPAADYMLYWSLAPGTRSMGEGLTLSIVTKGSPGLSFRRNGWDDIIGLRSSVSVSATLDNVFIPWNNVLGEPGDFIQKDPYTLELSQAFHLVGCAQGAFDCIARTLKDRPFLQKEEGLMVTFGEFSSAIQAARASCLWASSLWDERQFGEAALASLRAHHMAREVALDVSTRGFDLVGTRSLFTTMPLQRYWRDIRTASLHTRDSQLVRLIADADLAGEYAPKQKYGARVDERKTWEKLGLKREGASVAA